MPKQTFAIDITDSEFYRDYVQLNETESAVILKNLPVDILAQFANVFRLIDVQYKGETCFALPVVVVRQRELGEKVKSEIIDPWGNRSSAKPMPEE